MDRFIQKNKKTGLSAKIQASEKGWAKARKNPTLTKIRQTTPD
jgi:hypothetical protein